LGNNSDVYGGGTKKILGTSKLANMERLLRTVKRAIQFTSVINNILHFLKISKKKKKKPIIIFDHFNDFIDHLDNAPEVSDEEKKKCQSFNYLSLELVL